MRVPPRLVFFVAALAATSAGELRAQPTTPVSGWLTLCADGACRQRMASGKLRALDASRGYADIGIRLVREG